MGALDSLQALEVARGLAGPFCGQFLAEAGARVIKVEPLYGDYARGWGPPFVGQDSATFTSVNRGKESIALDLITEEGKEVLRRLAQTSDIIVENLLPDEIAVPVMDYDELSRDHPDLVYCAIRDFSEEGALKDMPGSELVYQGLSDYMNSLGRLGEDPIRVGADVAEMGTGLFAYIGILAALYHRNGDRRGPEGQGGQARHFDADAQRDLGGIVQPRCVVRRALRELFPTLRSHGVQAGERPIYFMLRRGSEELFDRLIIRLGIEWVATDPRFANGGREAMGVGRYAPEVKPIWEGAFEGHTTDEVLEIIREHGGEGLPFLDYPSLAQHPPDRGAGYLRGCGVSRFWDDEGRRGAMGVLQCPKAYLGKGPTPRRAYRHRAG